MPRRQQSRAQNLDELVAIARKLYRVDLDAVAEAANARAVGGLEVRHEPLRRLAHQIEVVRHAAAAVQHDDDGDGLEIVGEDRHGLPLAVVVHLEVVDA